MSITFATVAKIILTNPKIIMSVANSIKRLVTTVKPLSEALNPLSKEMFTPAAMLFKSLLLSEEFDMIVEKQNIMLQLLNSDEVQKGLDNLGGFVNAFNKFSSKESTIIFYEKAFRFAALLIHVLAEVIKIGTLSPGELIDWCAGYQLQMGGGEWDLDGNYYDLSTPTGYFGFLFHKYKEWLGSYEPYFDWTFWNTAPPGSIGAIDHPYLIPTAPPGAEANFNAFLTAYSADPSLRGFQMPELPPVSSATTYIPPNAVIPTAPTTPPTTVTTNGYNVSYAEFEKMLAELGDAGKILTQWRTW